MMGSNLIYCENAPGLNPYTGSGCENAPHHDAHNGYTTYNSLRTIGINQRRALRSRNKITDYGPSCVQEEVTVSDA
jgi:hypothetical protein